MPKSNTQRRFARVILALIVVIGIPSAGVAMYWMVTIPDVASLARTNPTTTALIQTWKHEHARRMNPEWIWMPLSKISPHLQRAVIVAEDASFFQHEGFDWEGIKHAAVKDLEAGTFKKGGSTITQQLAKNLYLSTDKTVLRKAKEALITRELEHQLTKKRILELYLNVAEWGRGVYGAEAAARHHFGKSALDVTPEEAALLAAILPAPTHYDPLRVTRYLSVRRQQILRWMDKRFPRSRSASSH
ncbi:MAG: monofunctional biosynthetic peptidoglycan transglycosylase [Nitrospirales bacterium]